MTKFTFFNKLLFTVLTLLILGVANAWGNSVSTNSSSDDISNNKIVLKGNHATFTISGGNNIGWNYVNYTLGSVAKNSSKEFTISWTCDNDCSIEVTGITFDITGYTSNLTEKSSLKASFNGETQNVGDLWGGMTSFGETNTTFSSGCKFTIQNKLSGGLFAKNRDFYFNNLTITYTITPKNAPTIKKTEETINVSLTNENKLDMTTLIGVTNVDDFMPVAWESSSYKTLENASGTGAGNFTGKYFYATKAGVYTYTNPYIAKKTNCHEKSATTSGTITITVNRLPQTLTMGNGHVFASKDKNSPTKFDLSTLKSQTGNGAVTYELVSWPNAMNGMSAADSCVIDGKNFYAWVAGTYTLRAKAAKTDQYDDVTSNNFTVTVEKNLTSISGTESYNVMVDGSVAISNYSVSNTSYATPLYGDTHNFYYTITNTLPANAVTIGCAAEHSSDVIGYNASNHTITAYNAGIATLTLVQKETDVYTGATKTFTITTHKYNSVFSNVANLNTKVEVNVNSNYVLTYTKPNNGYAGTNHTAGTPTEGENSGNWYYVLGHKVTTTEQTDCPEIYKNVAITYAAATKTATGRNQGVDTVHLYQKETYKYNSASTSFRVNVTKNNNTISYKWNNENHVAWSETMNFDEQVKFTFSANNPNSIDIVQTKGVAAGDTVATYSPETNKITAYYNKGQAIWTLHQDENYKYVEANAKCTVTVKEKPCETCYAYKWDPDDNVSNINEVSWGVDSVAKELTFDMKAYGTVWGDDALLSYWVINAYQGPDEIKADNQITYKPVKKKSLDPHTTGLKFEKGGDIISTNVGTARTDDPKVNNIRVSRLTWLELNSTQTGKALDTLYIHKEIGEASKSGSFQLKISTCDNIVKLASNDSKVTLSETSIALATGSTYDGGYVVKNINVTYTCDKKDTTDAIISAYTKYEHKTFVVRAITKANDQEIVWKEGYKDDIVSLPVNGYVSISDAASASSGLLPILYSTNNPAVIQISDDFKSFMVIAAGTATLTARQAGNDEYEPAEDTKNIQGTEKIIQSIVWDDNFTRSMTIDKSQKMTASVDTLNTITNIYEHSEERTAKLVYSCPKNNGVIEIIDSCYLHVLAEGTTTVTASVKGDSRYEGATYTKRVFVRPASIGCESHNVYVQKDSILFYRYDLNMPELTQTITFSPDSGVPDMLSFSVRGVSYHRLGRDFFEKDIDVYQSIDHGANWIKLKTVDAVKDSTVLSGDIQLDPNAMMLKFVRPQGGQGYHYIEDIIVTRKQILSAVNETINLGDVPAGSIRVENISFIYSELKSTELKVEKGDGDETYNTLEIDESIVIECGSFGHENLEFKFKPTKVGAWSQTVTITDPISAKTITVTINANVTLGTQSIDWNPALTTFYTVQEDEFNSQLPQTSNRGLDVALKSLNSSVVSFSGKNATIKGAGPVTIEATCTGNDNYHDAEKVSKEYTILRTPTAITTLPVIGTIHKGETAGSVSLNTTAALAKETVNNTSVEGTYAITSPAVFSEGQCDVTVTFTPKYSNLFAPSTAIISVNVEPAVFTYTGTGDWTTIGNWNMKEVPGSGDEVIVNGDVTISDSVVIKGLTIMEGAGVTINVEGSLKVGDSNSKSRDNYGDLHVKEGGKVTLTTGRLNVRDFILDAKLGDSDTKKAASGQVVAPEKLNIHRKAYFQMTFDPEGAISYGWYDFTVPFEVDINGGISRINSAADKVMVCGTDFLIMEADEQNRANGGKGWRQLHGGVINPGKLYTIGFDDGVNQNTFLFAWNGNGNLANSNSYAVRYATGGDGSKNGWNGMGNGMLRHGYPDCSYKKQAYNHKDNVYNLVDGNVTFAVGSAFFIQVPAAGSLAWVEDMADARPVFAPKHEVEQVEECRLTLRDENDKQVDVLYYSASEEATDAYVIGKDLLKLGTPTEAKVAQMWATKGGKKLCDIEAALVNDNAVAPLSLFTPKAGEYMLSVEQMPEDATLYLTYNDQVIWDLTQGAYMFVLEKGSTEGYGLSLQAKRAPQVTTGMENTNADSHSVRKVLINNTIYIITPEGEMYNIMGKNIQ